MKDTDVVVSNADIVRFGRLGEQEEVMRAARVVDDFGNGATMS